jgi:O-antigen ligase
LGFGDLLYTRLVGQTNTGDMSTTSSGRVDFWMHALRVMADQPITFLTGYGWRAYWTMPFRYSPHNFYINMWFNLGVVGLGCGLVLLLAPVREAYAAIERVSARGRVVLIGFSVGSIAFAVATFFVDLFVPWLYYWAYAGLALRIAVSAKETPASAIRMPVNSPARRTRVDPFGWAGSAQRQ